MAWITRLALEFEPADLQQIPGGIGSDGEHLGRVVVWFEIDHGDGMLEGVANGRGVDAMLMSRSMNFHIKTYCNT
jgi:hypothetical protein